MKRRLFQIMGIVAVMFLCVGCGKQTPDDYATNDGYSIHTEQTEDISGGIAKENVKVGVLYISDPAEGSGYSYTHDLGVIGMKENIGLSEDQVVRKIVDDGDSEATKEAIRECIDEGCNIIFTTSWGYMETTAEMAEEYPDVYFSHGTGYMSNGMNFNNYFGRIYQTRYLSGIVAGMNTTTNRIGYVAAMDATNSEVTGGIDAFAIGVASVNPDAKIYVKVTNSWYDAEKEEQASKELLDMDCDVMAQHCDTPFPQTLAQERGVYGIGYNSDMSKETPDSCLCSVVWNWSAYYTKAVNSIINGTWTGENYYGGLADGVVELTTLASFVKEGTQEKVDQARADILSGENNVFDGELETNDGKIIGTEGGTLDDATITGGIDCYYHNVVIVE